MGNLCCRISHWSVKGFIRSSSLPEAPPSSPPSGLSYFRARRKPLLYPSLQITLHSISASASRQIQLIDWVTLKATVMPISMLIPNPNLQSVWLSLPRQGLLSWCSWTPRRQSPLGQCARGWSLSAGGHVFWVGLEVYSSFLWLCTNWVT